jgi:hypothetical protein
MVGDDLGMAGGAWDFFHPDLLAGDIEPGGHMENDTTDTARLENG